EAAEVMGLKGLTLAWRHLATNIQQLAALTSGADKPDLNAEQSLLVDSWTLYFLDYLQRLGTDNLSASAVSGLAEFLGNDAWPAPLDETQQQELIDHLAH